MWSPRIVVTRVIRHVNGRVEPDMKRLMATAALALVPLCAADMASAQTYPARSIQVIVPFAGGSASDVITRVLLDRMGTSMGRRFIVDNRPGAGGNTGTAAAAKADPDGYTLVMSTLGPLAANKTLFRDLGYDPENDFAPISLFAIVPNVIVVSAKLPVTSLKEFIDYARQRPKEINYGSVGPGSSQHLAGVYFEQVVGIEMTHVPYRNIAQYVPDLIAGSVPAGFQFLPNVNAPLQSGGARALAVTSEKRMSALPDVPTVAEAGITGYAPSGWLALLAPRGTPQPVIARLHEELAAAIGDAVVREKFSELGAEAVASTPEELARFISSEIVKWRGIITKAGITVQ
jgi:tripartite-type tricarboxylate transporter receptor subunit TctC